MPPSTPRNVKIATVEACTLRVPLDVAASFHEMIAKYAVDTWA